MPNYDHEVLGVGNAMHPANKESLEYDKPTNMSEALSWYSEFNDTTYLLEQIKENAALIGKIKEKLVELTKFSRAKNENLIANELCKIKQQLDLY
jgi:hypothetical protein